MAGLTRRIRIHPSWATRSAAGRATRWSSTSSGSTKRPGSTRPGIPHTEALHIIERFTRTNEATLHYQVTIDDPHAYTKPWTTSYTIPWAAGAELLEYICQENNKDLPHMVGR